MKKYLLLILVLFGLMAFAGHGWSLTINSGAIDVGDIDTIHAQDTLSNSGYHAELAWVKSKLGPLYYFAEYDKIEFGTDPGQVDWEDYWTLVDGQTTIWAGKLPSEPPYYFIKIGAGGLEIPDHYLFTNKTELAWAVIDLSSISTKNNFNIYRISHIAPIEAIPEPATMLLLGSGLLGLAGVARRRFKK